jgi:hypothetical protein
MEQWCSPRRSTASGLVAKALATAGRAVGFEQPCSHTDVTSLPVANIISPLADHPVFLEHDIVADYLRAFACVHIRGVELDCPAVTAKQD